jgi:alkylhydroperoxidase family enzyme
MGHSEMLLAVAGLSDDEIKKRTKKLAEGDWSDYTPAEQRALQFAHKISGAPSTVTAWDVKGLVDAFGRDRAIDLIWYGGWCNYMTRVADAFQLPLEKENVFIRPKKKDGGKEPKEQR